MRCVGPVIWAETEPLAEVLVLVAALVEGLVRVRVVEPVQARVLV